MKANATAKITVAGAVLAMLLSTGAWAQNQDPKSPTAYGTGSIATDQGPPTADYQNTGKNKPKHKKSQKHDSDMTRQPAINSSGASGTSGNTGGGYPAAGDPRPAVGDPRPDIQPMTPTGKPVDDSRTMPAPDVPPIR